MFGRGNWAVIGIAKDSLESFKSSLEDQRLMLAVSQLAASAVTRHIKIDAIGINPFSAPRLDEQHDVELTLEQELARFAASAKEARVADSLPAELVESEAFGVNSEAFQLHDSLPWFGLWAVSNVWKDISDIASVKEQHAYTALERPYRFLQAIDRRSVDRDIRGTTAAVRKQFAVLLDFNEGRAYIENTNKKTIVAVSLLLKQLEIEVIPSAWTYNRADWPAAILNRIHEGSQFQSDFQKRAEEAARFKPNEIEKLEDRELESVVAHFFAMTELPSDLWVGISTPAQVRLHPSSEPIAVKAPTNATALLSVTNDARMVTGALTFQDRISTRNKKGEERTFRKDMLSLDLNDGINLTDAGAAMLRGFDIPSYRKDIQREIRQTKQVPSIDEFWSGWLHQMNNAVRTIEASFREILELGGEEKGGILPMKTASQEEMLEFENA